MGSCYSIHLILQNNNQYNNECLICFENIHISNDYVKCRKCKILLHYDCAVKYKVLQKCRSQNCHYLKCPHCQSCKTSYLYKSDDIYNF
jgi:hypothetical protein